jgi:hypothetical protein
MRDGREIDQVEDDEVEVVEVDDEDDEVLQVKVTRVLLDHKHEIMHERKHEIK